MKTGVDFLAKPAMCLQEKQHLCICPSICCFGPHWNISVTTRRIANNQPIQTGCKDFDEPLIFKWGKRLTSLILNSISWHLLPLFWWPLHCPNSKVLPWSKTCNLSNKFIHISFPFLNCCANYNSMLTWSAESISIIPATRMLANHVLACWC